MLLLQLGQGQDDGDETQDDEDRLENLTGSTDARGQAFEELGRSELPHQECALPEGEDIEGQNERHEPEQPERARATDPDVLAAGQQEQQRQAQLEFEGSHRLTAAS